ncbi:MAG: esterase-like activity of phytase family protein, partial [Dehalococcoidia bacterium]
RVVREVRQIDEQRLRHSGTDLLVMERSFVPDVGTNVRIHRVSLAGGQNVLTVENLNEATPALAKALLVDLANLPDDAFPEPRQPQPNRILDNFEGIALGLTLPDGRRLLFVVSDDNKRDPQTPRVLVLAVAGL